MGRGRSTGRRHERPHRPHELGPRLFRRGRWWAADLRPWGGGRVTLRDPRARGWPRKGERTELRDVAEKWKWTYVEYAQSEARARQLGIRDDQRTLGDAADQWLRHRERVVSANTWKGSRGAITRLMDRIGSDTRLVDITADDLQAIFHGLLLRGYAPGTLATERWLLSSFFKWAGVEPNPAKEIELPEVPKSDARAWTDEEIELLRAAADEVDRQRQSPPSARMVLELVLATGLRQQELFALDWTAIDRRTRTVRVTRQLDRSRPIFRPLKGKNNRTAVVLPSWWEWHRDDARGLVLAGPNGQPLQHRRSGMLFDRVLKVAGIKQPGMRLHSGRHTYARLFLEAGGWMDELQTSLGHKSIRTTEQAYEHFAVEKRAGFAAARIYGEGRRLRLLQ